MGDIRSESFGECSAVGLDPSFDFVVLVGREVVRVTEDHVAECLVLTHLASGLDVECDVVEMVVEHRAVASEGGKDCG